MAPQRNKQLELAVANAIVVALWLKNLLTEEQKNKLIESNTMKILS